MRLSGKDADLVSEEVNGKQASLRLGARETLVSHAFYVADIVRTIIAAVIEHFDVKEQRVCIFNGSIKSQRDERNPGS